MKRQILSNEALAAFFREMTLLFPAKGTAGALAAMARDSNGPDKKLLSEMAAAVKGATLFSAMEKTGRFPEYAQGLMKVGEQTGRIEEVLASLAGYYEGRERLTRRIRGALLYPAVMLVLMLAVIGVLLVRVLPIFDDVYASLGGRLTGVAGGLLALGRGLDRIMPVLWVILALGAVFALCFACVPAVREKTAALWRSGWGDKGVARKLNNAHMVQAIAMGIAADKSQKKTMERAAGLMRDVPQAKGRCELCMKRMEEGVELEDALKESGLLSAHDYRLLRAAETAGSKDAALEQIAASLSVEGEAELEEKVSLVEPALVLVCSVLVGLILLSVMLPLMHIMSAIG